MIVNFHIICTYLLILCINKANHISLLLLDVETMGSTSVCEMLYRTNVLVIASGGSRPKFADNTLLLYDDVLKKFLLEITFPSSIKAVRLRRDK